MRTNTLRQAAGGLTTSPKTQRKAETKRLLDSERLITA